jgi:two-component system sensor histidine kinase KdpD
VYVKAQAERALKHFFQPGNLTALRELALRRAAQHVDRDMVDYMRTHAIGGPWPVTERVLVCVNEHPSSAELVRRARRIADNLKAEWTALYVESARHSALDEGQKDHAAGALRLAQRLGAESLTLPGRNIADTILNFARTNNVTQIVIAKSDRPWWFELLHGSVVRDLIRHSEGINISVISAKAEPVSVKTIRTAERAGSFRWRDYGLSLLATAVTAAIAAALGSTLTLGSAGMLFLVPVLISAVSFGLWPALFTSFVSVMAYNFFFLPPRYTFTIADPNNWLSFAILLFVAVIASNLAARVRTEANLAAARAAIAGNLYSFAGKLAGIALLDDILWASAFQISSMLKANVVILLPDLSSSRLTISVGYPPEDELDPQDMAAAQWSWEKRAPAGRHSETLTGAKRLFLPMRTGAGAVGVIGLQWRDEDAPLTPEERRLLDALIDQTALAIERAQLAERADKARVLAETDKLRVAMLTSLSHDLRTPLAAILGAATTLMSNLGLYDAARTQELLATIREEAERLNRFVGNLLDMSRLEAGVLGTKLEFIDISDAIDSALARFARRLADHRVEKDVPPNLPFAKADPALLEQALINVLDNAAKYSAPATAIRIGARAASDRIVLTISDEGSGIPEDELEHIFDKFYRAKEADRRIAGTGLGLAVARGFVEAFGGALTASNRIEQRGAIFHIDIPAAAGSEAEHGIQTS